MLNKTEAQGLVKAITALTQYYALVSISQTSQGTTRFANSEISQNILIEEGRISLTLFDGKKQATSATNDFSKTGLETLVKNAEATLQYVPEGEFGAFPFSTAPVAEKTPSTALLASFDTAARASYIKEGVALLEDGFTASGALVLLDTVTILGDSEAGFRYANYQSVAFNTVVTHTSGADGAGECISYNSSPDVLGCFKKAMATAKAALDPVEPTLGGLTVVLSPTAFGDLVSFVTNSLNAKGVQDGYSFAVGKLGQKIFGDNITITDDVTHPDLLPLTFDAEGNPKKALALIENGVIKNYVYDNKRAQKDGVETTGHAIVTRWYQGAIPTNIVVAPGTSSVEDMIKSTACGVFVNEFHYTNFVNPRTLQVTGLTRNGTFMIEDGKLTKPLTNARFTESLLDAFCNITEISQERELVSGFGAALVPGVKIENFHFTSKS